MSERSDPPQFSLVETRSRALSFAQAALTMNMEGYKLAADQLRSDTLPSVSGRCKALHQPYGLLTFQVYPSALDDEKDAAGKKIEHRGTLAKVIGLVVDHIDHAELLKELHAMLRGNFGKGDFAATLFERLNRDQALACPAYIADVLTWMSIQLNATVGEIA